MSDPEEPASADRAGAAQSRLADYRRLADFGGRGALSVAELALLDACPSGKPCAVGDLPKDRSWPERPDAGNRIAAGFLRFLLLGGDGEAPVHDRGIDLEGAWIEGELDLNGISAAHTLELKRCRIQKVTAQWATLRTSGLVSCLVEEGIDGDGLNCKGTLLIRHGTEVRGAVRLPVAKIEGGLYCEGAVFNNPAGRALDCTDATITGPVGLNGWYREDGAIQRFRCAGAVDLNGCTIGGNLDCSEADFSADGQSALGCSGAKIGGSIRCRNSSFRSYVPPADAPNAGLNVDALNCWGAKVTGHVFLDGEFSADGVSLLVADIGGSLSCTSGSFLKGTGSALHCEGTKVGQIFFFRNIRQVGGTMNLLNMQVDSLADEMESWRKAEGRLNLDGFTYNRLIYDPSLDESAGPGADAAEQPTTRARDRIAWLKMQEPDNWRTGFRPQPWEQLIKVLRAMGHPDRARSVAVARERTRGAVPRPSPPDRHGRMMQAVQRLLNPVFGTAAGYGYQPERLALFVPLVWLVCAMIYLAAAPACGNDRACAERAWLVPARSGAEAAPHAALPPTPSPLPRIDPWFFSADVLLPNDLGYGSAWKPSENWGGWAMRWLIGLEAIFGSIVTGLLIALVGRSFIKPS